jgi:hypothetical protein
VFVGVTSVFVEIRIAECKLDERHSVETDKTCESFPGMSEANNFDFSRLHYMHMYIRMCVPRYARVSLS